LLNFSDTETFVYIFDNPNPNGNHKKDGKNDFGILMERTRQGHAKFCCKLNWKLWNNLMDIETRVKALRLSWIPRILDSTRKEP